MMSMSIKTMLLAATATILALPASAQREETAPPQSLTYVELQGGANLTMTNANACLKLVRPIGALSVGHYFSPEFGMRLHVDGWQAKNRYYGNDYSWKFATADIDCLFNISNILNYRRNYALNFIVVAGIGAAKLWDVGGIETYTELNHHKLVHNMRAGLRLETNMAKPVGLSFEVDANNIGTHFQAQNNYLSDWMFSAMVGLTFRLDRQMKHTARPQSVPVVQDVVEQQHVEAAPATVKATATPAKAPAPVVETIHEEIFYPLRATVPADADQGKLQRVAQYLKNHPQATIEVVGYADRGTGNARVNARYAEKRAAAVKDALVRLGADASRITVASKGDTVQPFADNDRNRVSIIDGTTKR